MKAIYFTLLFINVLVLAGCSAWERTKDEEFSFQRRNYTGNNLRLDGFYYLKWINDGVEEFYGTTFLYRNGILLGVGGGGSMIKMEEYIKKYIDINYKSRKSGWGLFIIKDNKIITEAYGATQLGYKVFHYEGIILNDTTFVMKEASKIIDGKKTEIKEINDVYHFKKFSPKPDSTNIFIP